MKDKINWICENDNSNIDIKKILKVERYFKVRFPEDYIEIVLKYDGAYPEPNVFEVNGDGEVFNNLLDFNENEYSNIIDNYNDVKDRLIEKIIPIAEDPFGNLICFDYRNNDEPTIVFWDHERAFEDKNSALSYVCNSFSELLLMLHESEEEE